VKLTSDNENLAIVLKNYFLKLNWLISALIFAKNLQFSRKNN
jgi:hypothetical protein